MKYLKAGLPAIALALALIPAAHAEDGVTDSTIVLGGAMPLTGGAGLLGYAAMLGERIAVEEINEAGGINGRKLELFIEDDGYVPAKGVQALQQLIDVNRIFAYLPASGGSHLFAQMPIIDENGIPTMNTVVTTAKHYDPPHPSFFGIGMTYSEGGYELLKYLNARHPGTKWAYIIQDDESGADRVVGYKKAAAETGAEIVSEQQFKRGQADFSSELLRVKESGATGLLLGGLVADNAAMVKEADKLGLDLVMGTLWIDHIPPFIGLVGDAGDGIYVYDYLPSITDETKMETFNALAKKYLSAEDLAKVNRYSVGSYVSLKVLAEGINRCGADVTRACVTEKIAGLKNFDTGGLTAPVTFGADVRLTTMTGGILQVDTNSKRFVPVQQ